MTTTESISTGIERLYASAPEPLPFDRRLVIRSFLLQRDQGNLLVYGTGTLERDAETLRGLGGISRQYLNHGHEAMFADDWPARAFGAQLVVGEGDAASVAKRRQVDETISERQALDSDFEAIPMPGHTPGATAFLWHTGTHRALFTGDSIYLRDGEWVAAVLESSDRSSYLESLSLIRELEFDVIVPWAATVGQPYYALTDDADARRRIDAIIERVRAGGSH
jgi:glyoxylase-like metal-dependent hydrolase (beta-lactamase superfamily II)